MRDEREFALPRPVYEMVTEWRSSAAPPVVPRCDDCACWTLRYGTPSGRYTGDCRRMAPLPEDRQPLGPVWWPQTRSDDWCGEFSPRAR